MPLWEWDKVGGTLTHDATGWHAVRIAHVSDVETTIDPDATLYRLMRWPPCPQRGDPHPSIGLLPVANRSGRTLKGDPFQFEITVVYELQVTGTPDTPDPAIATLKVGATLQTTQTMRNAAGELITVKYNTGTDSDGQKEWSEQAVQVAYQEPQTTYRYHRREAESPGAKSGYYVAKTNATNVPGVLMVGEADNTRKWLCTRLEGESQDNGQTWEVDYEFHYNEDLALVGEDLTPPTAYESGWDPVVAYKLANGDTPVDIMAANHWEGTGEARSNQAIKREQVLKSVQFGDDLPPDMIGESS